MTCPRHPDAMPPSVDLEAAARALPSDDVDAALQAGLLQWNGCEACARASGLQPADIARLQAARTQRVAALAARERHHARMARLQARARAQARTDAAAAAPGLPSAAAAALARAKAKAGLAGSST